MTSTFERFNQWMRGSVTLKLISVGILILLMLIPMSFIQSLIREREMRRNEVIDEVSYKWGKSQTLTGPYLSIPYRQYLKNEKGEMVESIEYAHFLPNDLNISGTITPEKLKRGIYEVVVYRSQFQFSGDFPQPDFSIWNIPEENIIWEDASMSLGITDMRGIQENIDLKWGDTTIAFNPGIENSDVVSSGVSLRAPVRADGQTASIPYQFNIDLNGSQNIHFTPLGKQTKVDLQSDWQNPSFSGEYLPDDRTIDESGFTASWQILHLNRNFPQKGGERQYYVSDSDFGVNLLLPVAQYQKSMRSAKYAIMFISLTFLIFFFVEILNRQRIHPIQYILVGLALCVFYTLLLSVSEYIRFNLAYVASAISVILLITLYCRSIFQQNLITAITGLILIILYGFMFVLLVLQDYSLLMGSIGLFIILATVMYLSRKVDWYNLGGSK